LTEGIIDMFLERNRVVKGIQIIRIGCVNGDDSGCGSRESRSAGAS
jgi:hypothetical protein